MTPLLNDAPNRGKASTTLLESKRNVVTVQEIRDRPCRCRCWYCPDCCLSMGLALRERLMPVLESFTGLMMLTLTVDPTLFGSPEAAYLYARERRVISRLMRELDRKGYLHSRRYFRVIEWQKQTEMVHYHVLIDATRVPKTAIDAAWSRFRPAALPPPPPNRPAFGLTRFSRRRFEGGAKHAARYATKYLLKIPDRGWPAWVLAAGNEYRIPRYQTSRDFWGNGGAGASVPATPAPAFPRPPLKSRHSRPYAERVADCGEAIEEFRVITTTNTQTGEKSVRYDWVRRWLPGQKPPRRQPDGRTAAAGPEGAQ